MKTLLICKPRTRSTLLIDAVSKFYGLSDQDENLKFTTGKFLNSSINANLENLAFDQFKGKIKNQLQNTFLIPKFAIKLYPRMLTFSPHEVQDLKDYNLKIIDNLSYYTNLKKFDKIFFLERDLIDCTLSWAYSSYINIYNFRDTETLSKHNQNIKKFEVPFDGFLKFYILESAILTKWKEYLIQTNINFICLNYNQIPNYVNDNYPNVIKKTIDSKFDYTKIISNYQDISNQITKFYSECEEYTKNLSFF